MKFYELSYSTAAEEIGRTFPQVQTSRDEISIDDPRHIRKKGFEFLVDAYIPVPIVHPNAKLSDLLSTVMMSRPVISPKLKSILERHSEKGKTQFLPVQVVYLNQDYEYWLLNPIHFDLDSVDFNRSEVWLCGAGNQKIRKIEIDSSGAFKALASQFHLPERLNIYNVALKGDTTKNYLQLNFVPGIKYCISEHVKAEIVAAGCTGISFVQL